MNKPTNRKFSENKAVKWIPLYLLKNCFKDGEASHLGFKHNEEYYCLTHSKSKVEIDAKYTRLKTTDDKKMYLTKAVSVPIREHSTGARLSKRFFLENFKKLKSEE